MTYDAILAETVMITGHAFFSVDRPSYRPEAAVDGWQRIWAFLDQHLAG